MTQVGRSTLRGRRRLLDRVTFSVTSFENDVRLPGRVYPLEPLMAGRDTPRGSSSDPDDWFAPGGVPLPAGPPGRQVDAPSEETVDEPDWLEAETREAGAPAAPAADQPRRRSALLALVALAVFAVIIVIAFLGADVFSSNKSSNPPPPPTTTAATTQPTTTTPSTITTPPSTTTVPTLTSGLLKQGTSGADVKALQQALAAAGHSPGAIDGDFGPKTEQALIAFQQAAGIPADGVYGPQTKAALEKKLNAG